MDLKGKVVLVTGGAGFIGWNLVKKLQSVCKKVFIVDDLSKGKSEEWDKRYSIFNNVFSHRFDLRFFHPSNLYELFVDEDIDVVFHLAAKVGSYETYLKNKNDVMISNMLIDLNVLNFCRLKGVKEFVYSSSSHVYPTWKCHEKRQTGLVESDTNQSQMFSNSQLTYGWEKLAFEKILNDCACEDFKVRILRYNGIYGPGQDFSLENGSFIPQFCNRILSSNVEIVTNGKEERSYMFIDDCINATLKVVQGCQDSKITLDVGSGEKISILELAQKLLTLTNSNLELKTSVKYAGLSEQWPNCEKLKKDFKFTCETPLEVGLLKVFEDVKMRMLK